MPPPPRLMRRGDRAIIISWVYIKSTGDFWPISGFRKPFLSRFSGHHRRASRRFLHLAAVSRCARAPPPERFALELRGVAGEDLADAAGLRRHEDYLCLSAV